MTPIQQSKLPVLPCWYLLPQRQSNKAQPRWLDVPLYLGRFSWLLKPLTSPAAWWEQAGQLPFLLLLPGKCAAPWEPWDVIQSLAHVQRPPNPSTAPEDKMKQDSVERAQRGDLVEPGQLWGCRVWPWGLLELLRSQQHLNSTGQSVPVLP